MFILLYIVLVIYHYFIFFPFLNSLIIKIFIFNPNLYLNMWYEAQKHYDSIIHSQKELE